MAIYQTVVAGTTITGAWGNNVRDGLVTRFASVAARTSAVPSPPTPFATWRTDANILEMYDGSNYVPPQANYKGSTSRTSAISTTTTEVLADSVTFTAVAGRRYKITWSGKWLGSIAGETLQVRFRYVAGASVTSAATMLRGQDLVTPGANYHSPLCLVDHVTGISGTYTVGMFVLRGFGNGTMQLGAAANDQAVMIVEDVGT